MQKLTSCLFLVLAACSTYQPVLKQQPKNTQKYESDLAECRKEAQPSSGSETSMLLGGAIGLAIHDAVTPGANDFEPASETIKNCLKSKKYQVAE